LIARCAVKDEFRAHRNADVNNPSNIVHAEAQVPLISTRSGSDPDHCSAIAPVMVRRTAA
jgi:hypothetical protein